MAANITQQYRPVTTSETSADDAYSVRALNDHAASINNGVLYSFAHPLLAIPCVPWWYSHDNTTAERVIAILAPVRVPQPYNRLAWTICHLKSAESAGADRVVWKLYSSEWSYYGDATTFDATILSPNYGSSSIVSNTLNTYAMPAAGTLSLPRGAGYTHLVLTATNDNTSTRGYITSITIWPVYV